MALYKNPHTRYKNRKPSQKNKHKTRAIPLVMITMSDRYATIQIRSKYKHIFQCKSCFAAYLSWSYPSLCNHVKQYVHTIYFFAKHEATLIGIVCLQRFTFSHRYSCKNIVGDGIRIFNLLAQFYNRLIKQDWCAYTYLNIRSHKALNTLVYYIVTSNTTFIKTPAKLL